MRITFRPRPDLEPWKAWFAWHPVLIGNTLVWLEWVERERELIRGWGDEWFMSRYRFPGVVE